jgi:hypothetical protein
MEKPKDSPHDVLFLQTVSRNGEKSRRGKARMLYCDAEGKVFTSRASKSVHELAKEIAGRTARNHRPFATIGLETIPGRLLPVVVEISEKESRVLERISEHAAGRGKLPEPLKQFLHRILTPAGAVFESVVPARRKHHHPGQLEITPRILEKYPGYHEHEISITMPIYKAAYRYPLVVLKKLAINDVTVPETISLLALDGEGDLVVVQIPEKLSVRLENGSNNADRNGRNVPVLLRRQYTGLVIRLMPITQHQKESLDTVTRYYTNTSSSKHPISLTAESVIEQAREIVCQNILQEALS